MVSSKGMQFIFYCCLDFLFKTGTALPLTAMVQRISNSDCQKQPQGRGHAFVCHLWPALRLVPCGLLLYRNCCLIQVSMRFFGSSTTIANKRKDVAHKQRNAMLPEAFCGLPTGARKGPGDCANQQFPPCHLQLRNPA